MEARNQRMLEELLKLPGNDKCADCHASAPRWASVNLGVFLCVGCASVHRKLGTHKSRVKSVTLDTWSRDQIAAIRNIGNTASNLIYNPNESLHPPPPSYGHDERDSEIEKYIRRKYEQGAFKNGTAARLDGRVEPTSLNRARERDGRLPFGANGGHLGLGKENRRNPELNNILVSREKKERDLPPIPVSSSAESAHRAPPRARPVRSPSNQDIVSLGSIRNESEGVSAQAQQPKVQEANLIDMSVGQSSTLPLQVDMSGASSSFFTAQSQIQQNQFLNAQPTSWGTGPNVSPYNGMMSYSYQPQMNGMNQNGLYSQYQLGQSVSPQSALLHMSSSPSFVQVPSPSFQYQPAPFQQPNCPPQQMQHQSQYEQFQRGIGQFNGQTNQVGMGMTMTGAGIGQPGSNYGYQANGHM
ncbi:uncharacterized protein L203_104764 [Cryptococcus depauperatus CBS 7841]|uniref:Uncharacterized protein n=1 Tax=Cryptococcus depauperatus CBS 7841 TaxID=1295531 RepID=A0A1E3INE5_9TREE|nr:hypothetical protein L203_02035 [Cryptococcus depauperatus CBS 7841]